jgi:hypothetical protein
VVEAVLDGPPVIHRLVLAGEQKSAGHQRLAQLPEQGPHDWVIGDTHANSALARMSEPLGHLPGRGEDERVCPRSSRLDGAELGVAQLDELTELREVRGHQREVVAIVEVADPADPIGTGAAV